MIFVIFAKFLKNLFYSTPLGDYFWLLPKDIKMTSIEAVIVTLMPTLNIFLSFAITLGAAIENNLTKSWRFS